MSQHLWLSCFSLFFFFPLLFPFLFFFLFFPFLFFSFFSLFFIYFFLFFRWFKFTLKPPNSMACGNFFLAICDTSHWNFLSNLDSRCLMTSPRTLLGQFWHMSIFGDSRAVQVICQKKMPSENQFFLDEGVTGLQSVLGVIGG